MFFFYFCDGLFTVKEAKQATLQLPRSFSTVARFELEPQIRETQSYQTTSSGNMPRRNLHCKYYVRKHITIQALEATQSHSPPSLQAATSAALVSRWSAFLTHAAATSFAASLLFEDLSPHHNHDGDLPPLGHFLSHTSPPCLSVASQHGSGRSGRTPSLPQAHLETGQYKNSLCLEAAQYNSPVSTDLLRLKRSGEEKKKNVRHPIIAYTQCFRPGTTDFTFLTAFSLQQTLSWNFVK